jgi:heme exporter protein A
MGQILSVMPALDLRALACTRGGRTLFQGLTRQVAPGELLRVQGANGAGKTSLLRMFCGLLQPAAGEVRWRGRNVAQLKEELGPDLVYIGHAAALKDDLSPLENLRAAQLLGGQPVPEAALRRALAEAGLRAQMTTPAGRLSQGQRRRSALARLVLAASAPLWVLDEPFNALDTEATGWLSGLIRAQLQRAGTVVLTSHQGVALDGVREQVLHL